MRKKVRSVYNVPDMKGQDGQWISTYTVTTETEYVQYWTRSFKLWVKVNGRCSDGYILKDRPSYIKSENKFKDFQQFAGWCQEQEGYSNKDPNGKFWSLDKDLIVEGNTAYSPETCLFVPNDVNQLFTSKTATLTKEEVIHRKSKKIKEILKRNDLTSKLRATLEDRLARLVKE
ncbi:hypothetical protein D3C85_293050 [compost metagenome]